MPTKSKVIPKEHVRAALAQLDEVLPRATAAANAVDSVLGFLLNHRNDQAANFTLLKESGTHYRHLAELFCPNARAAIEELLPNRGKRRRRAAPTQRVKSR